MYAQNFSQGFLWSHYPRVDIWQVDSLETAYKKQAFSPNPPLSKLKLYIF